MPTSARATAATPFALAALVASTLVHAGCIEDDTTDQERCRSICHRMDACGLIGDAHPRTLDACLAECGQQRLFTDDFASVTACVEGVACDRVTACTHGTLIPGKIGACLEANPGPPESPLLLRPRESGCRRAGYTGCDAGAWINAEAAMCIATAAGLEEGLEPWATEIILHGDFTAPFWSVSNVLERRGPQTRSGRMMYIDANTGELVADGEWNTAP